MVMVGQNASRIRRQNRTLVLECLRRYGPLSRLQIAQKAQLTPGTITHLAGLLLQEGLIMEIGEGLEAEQGRPGRRSTLLSIAASARMVLGVHVRPDEATLALVDLSAAIVSRQVIPLASESDPDQVIEQIVTAGTTLIQSCPVPVIGIGIGAAGLVDPARGEIVRSPYLGWARVSLRERLSRRFGLPAFIDNNARAMALAESLFGAAKGTDNLVLLFVGRGIGAGILVEGVPFRGGEIGHTTILPDGPLCWCGNRGCLEALASESALTSRLQSLLVDGEDPIETLLAASDALPALRAAGTMLGIALANTVSLMDIDRVVLAGKLLRPGSPVSEALEEAARQRAFLGPGRSLQFLTSEFGADVGLIGAGSLALRSLIYSTR